MCSHSDPALDRAPRGRTTDRASAVTSSDSSTTFTAEDPETGDEDVTFDLGRVSPDLKDAVLRAVIRNADTMECMDDESYDGGGDCLEVLLTRAARVAAPAKKRAPTIDQLMGVYSRHLIERLGRYEEFATGVEFKAVQNGLNAGRSPSELRSELEALWHKSIDVGYFFPQVEGYEEAKES